MARLLVRSGPRSGEVIDVADEVTFGRTSTDVVLDDSEVSRRHAVVRTVETGVEVADLGSLNGTWVNGQRIEAATLLRDGDRVTIGISTMEVQETQAESGRTIISSQPVAHTTRATAPARAPDGEGLAGSNDTESAAPAAAYGAFGSFAPPEVPKRRGPATRRVTPIALSLATVLATGVALIAYFAQR